jgi:hypothetical protein
MIPEVWPVLPAFAIGMLVGGCVVTASALMAHRMEVAVT